MTAGTLPTRERREQYRDAEPDRVQAIAGVDAMCYCPTCETSHPATQIEVSYAVGCPRR